MKLALVLCLVVLGLPAVAQITDPGGPTVSTPYPQLSRYFQLTGDQVVTLVRLNSDWNRYLLEKRLRISQINRELDDVSKQDNPDPMSFGVRYSEMEAICREAKDRLSEYRQKSRGLLNATQAQKLQVLEQAFALAPVILEAQNANMMGHEVKVEGPIRVGLILTGLYGITPNFIESLPGCRPPTITAIIIPALQDPTQP